MAAQAETPGPPREFPGGLVDDIGKHGDSDHLRSELDRIMAAIDDHERTLNRLLEELEGLAVMISKELKSKNMSIDDPRWEWLFRSLGITKKKEQS